MSNSKQITTIRQHKNKRKPRSFVNQGEIGTRREGVGTKWNRLVGKQKVQEIRQVGERLEESCAVFLVKKNNDNNKRKSERVFG